MTSFEKRFHLRNPKLFIDASLHLERCLKEVWHQHSQENHNKVVGAINRMVYYATDDGKDETAASVKFSEIVLDLEMQGYPYIADLKFKDFRKYLDKDGNPYE